MLCHIQLNLYGSRICLTLVFLFCVLLKNKLNAKISKGDTMLYDFIIIDKTSSAPLYMQIYASIRRSVENGSLVKNTKLPSVRQLSSGLEVSKTTVSAAYEQLCVEGYIKNKPQSGYYVEAQFENAPKKSENTHSSAIAQIKRYDYDFSGKSIDDKIINIDEWKKYVKEVINTGYMLMSYGEPQGETVLRNALQKYSLGVRSVNTSAENIVVGAGTQLLLYLLCSLVGTNKTVAMAKSSYIQAEFIFKTLGLDIKYFDTDSKGITISSLEKIKPDMVLINPNFIAENGMSMPVSRRLELIKWAKENDCIIIEDDYNGELRYSTHPMPCVQNYDIENTVYLGSFSKILLPSVRISYMVLPDKLLKKYRQISPYINQTASKTEQNALAKYLENRRLDAHLRKARRVYLEKSKQITDCVYKYFGSDTQIIFNETSLYISVKIKGISDYNEIRKKLDENNIAVMPEKAEINALNLSFSGISVDKIDAGIKRICDVIDECSQRGSTILKAQGGYKQDDIQVVMCACNSKEMYQVRKSVKDADPDSFIVVVESHEVHGEGFKMTNIGEAEN